MSENIPERSLPSHCVSGAAIVTNDEGKFLRVNIVFKGRYVSGEPRTSDESVEVGWFTKDEALKLLKDRERVLMRFKNALEDKIFVVSPADSYIFD